jgi:myo-inositol 2-dehydrogenase/D-chiro-inositol 1-dehydrogenase
MTDGRVRIGFAGAGFIANVHAGILAADPRVRVATVFDANPQAAALFALRHGVAVAPSLDDLLRAIDALYICTPNASHAAIAVRALHSGLHVFSEKPMATSLEDARAVHSAATRATGSVYQAGFNRRFALVYKELKARIASGALTPTSALLKMNRGELQRPAWTGDAAISGGFLYETPIHMLDLARHLFGEPAEVICRARTTVYDQLDDFSMLFTFASGMSAVLAASAHATWLFPFERIEIYGEHAIAATEEMERITFGRGIGAAAETIDVAQTPFERRWGYVEEDALFVAAMLGEGPPAVGVDEALRTTELVERCYAAARAPADS